MKRTKVNIGSVSHGTMRPEDLIPDFVYELKSQGKLTRNQRNLVRGIESRMKSESYYESEESGWDLESLLDALNEHAPAYFYFGAHPGDGSDYGYWLSEDFAAEDFDGPKVSDSSELPKGHVGEYLVINDHGNVSLYVRGRNGHTREIWAIV